jgi:hypothetical protein
MQLHLLNSGSIHEKEARRYVTHNQILASTKENLTGFIPEDTRAGGAIAVLILKIVPMIFRPCGGHCDG